MWSRAQNNILKKTSKIPEWGRGESIEDYHIQLGQQNDKSATSNLRGLKGKLPWHWEVKRTGRKHLRSCNYRLFSSVQLLSHVQLFATPWIAARQASLSITNSRSLPKPMSIESVVPSSHLILCHELLCNLQLKFTSSAWSPNHDFEVILDWWRHSLKQMRYSLRKIFILTFKQLPWLLLLLLLSHSVVSSSLQPHRLQHARLPCPSPTHHFHWVGGAIQPSCSLSSPSPPALNLFQHQSLF